MAHARTIAIKIWLFACTLFLVTGCDKAPAPQQGNTPKSSIAYRTYTEHHPRIAGAPRRPLLSPGEAKKPFRGGVDTGLISGTVRVSSGARLASTTLELHRSNAIGEAGEVIASTVPDPHGKFYISPPPGEEFFLKGSNPESADSWYLIRWKWQSALVPPPPVQRDVYLTPAQKLTGRVLGAENEPIQGATVQVRVRTHDQYRHPALVLTTQSDALGRFQFDKLSSGPIELSSRCPGYRPLSANVSTQTTDTSLVLSREGGSIEGNIFFRDSGLPASGTTVTLSELSGVDHLTSLPLAEATAGTLGDFRFFPLPPGRYSLKAIHGSRGLTDGYGNTAVAVSLAENETTSGLELFLDSGSTLAGQVLDETTSRPIADALVQVHHAAGISSTTSLADGSYYLAGLFGPRIHISATADGYFMRTEDAASSGSPLRIAAQASSARTHTILMNPLSILRGQVVDETNAPVAGASVRIVLERPQAAQKAVLFDSAISDTTGSFLLRVPPADPEQRSGILLKAHAEQYPERAQSIGNSTSITIRLLRGIAVRGKVYDSEGNPLEGVHVAPGEGNQFALSDSTGAFALGPVSRYGHLTARRTGYVEAGHMLNAPRDALVADVNFVLKRGPQPGAAIAGKVLDSSGMPVSNAWVSVSHRECWTSPGGEFRFEGLPADGQNASWCGYTVRAYAGKYGTAVRFCVPPGTADADLILSSTVVEKLTRETNTPETRREGDAIVAGSLLRADDGSPVAGKQIRLASTSENSSVIPPMTFTNSSGRFSFFDLAAGKYQLDMDPPRLELSLDVAAGEHVELRLLLGTGQIYAIALQGKTALNLPISLRQLDGPVSMFDGEQESYAIRVFRELPAGTYVLATSYGVHSTSAVVTLSSGKTEEVILQIPPTQEDSSTGIDMEP